MKTELSVSDVKTQIYFLRGYRVMLDSSLANFYGIETKALKRAVRRNREKFPEDFMFEANVNDLEILTRQFGVVNPQIKKEEVEGENQKSHGGVRYSPFVFTEPGIAMLSTTLKSHHASEVAIVIMRAFVHLRKEWESSLILAENIKSLESNFQQQLAAMSNSIQMMMDAVATLTSRLGSAEKLLLNSPLQISSDSKNQKISSKGLSNNSNGDQFDFEIERIQSIVAKHYGISIKALHSSKRVSPSVFPRQVCMYFFRKKLGISFKGIGSIFGGKDHTTVLYACQKIGKILSSPDGVTGPLSLILTEIST